MFGKGGLGGLMKQAQQMQEKMQKMQEEIAQLEVTGESGAGLVKITINGAHNCRRITKRKNGFCNRRHAITSRNETSILIHRVCEFIDSHTIHFLPS